MNDLLFEIGTEEIPAGYIRPALTHLTELLESGLAEKRLEPKEIITAGTPRRLTAWVNGVPEAQLAARKEIPGPPAKVAFDDTGKPTNAAKGFARAQKVSVQDLITRETDKGKYVFAVLEQEGAKALEVLPSVLKQATEQIGFPRSMRWPLPSDGEEGIRFARPIRWLVAIMGKSVLPLRIAGLQAGRKTYGHPFLAPEPVELEDASLEKYRSVLEEQFVLVGFQQRRELIQKQVENLGALNPDPDLLEEVANLVEYPHAVAGAFDEEFLETPDSVLAAAMTKHQRYFPVWNDRGEMENRFVVVSNRTEKQSETVREGNERVLRARLADARFFWDEDRKIRLEDRVDDLVNVRYLGGLGDNLQRTKRLRDLAELIAGSMGVTEEQNKHVRRAATLCKADLLTDLVGEFPGLQGAVGGELAREEGEAEPVVQAISDHYRPTGASDEPPKTVEGCALAIADKLDVIVGCFALGELPTGNQDPYGLRRNALAVMRILYSQQIEAQLSDLVSTAVDVLDEQGGQFSGDGIEVPFEQVMEFFRDRLYHAAVENGYRHDQVRSVLAAGFDFEVPRDGLNWNIYLFWERLEALEQLEDLEWWPDLVELVDRTCRIQKDLEEPLEIDHELLEEAEEKDIVDRLDKNAEAIRAGFAEAEYKGTAERYCQIFAGPVHEFFEEVFVNVDDRDLRRNRKAICAEVYRLFAWEFADLYLVVDDT